MDQEPHVQVPTVELSTVLELALLFGLPVDETEKRDYLNFIEQLINSRSPALKSE